MRKWGIVRAVFSVVNGGKYVVANHKNRLRVIFCEVNIRVEGHIHISLQSLHDTNSKERNQTRLSYPYTNMSDTVLGMEKKNMQSYRFLVRSLMSKPFVLRPSSSFMAIFVWLSKHVFQEQ